MDTGKPYRSIFFGGTPTAVLQNILRWLDDELTSAAAEKMSQEMLEAIPNFDVDPNEWSWHGRIISDRNGEARTILLEGCKPQHRWTRRIRLPR